MQNIKISNEYFLYALAYQDGQYYVVSPYKQPKVFSGCKYLWCIRKDYSSAILYKTDTYSVEIKSQFYSIDLDNYEIEEFNSIPNRDILNNKFEFSIDNNSEYTSAVAYLYWKNLLCQCVEKSAMKTNKNWKEGYVLSTLQVSKYAGTYPAVDHEFHIRARLALASSFELNLIKRMMNLQIKTMKKDLFGNSRIPCSIQPSGKREYKVMRKSLDKTVKAQMFPLTGIIELCEEMYNYYCITKDINYVKENIESLEMGMSNVINCIDNNNILHAQVYYEDQVMKDDINVQAQAFAINSLMLLSKLEKILERNEKSDLYLKIAKELSRSYYQNFFDLNEAHYIDYINKDGSVHDHFHLLSNALSVTYKINDRKRSNLVVQQIKENDKEFQRFPSFLSAKTKEYTNSEIGSGGPYDLCAAGRYWCHDSKFRREINDYITIKDQLDIVMNQAKAEDYYLGERYDMNYAYYNTGTDSNKMWHGAEKYYEYPCVFIDVLIHDFFGILPSENYDLKIKPNNSFSAKFLMDSYGIEYSISSNVLCIRNTSTSSKEIELELNNKHTPTLIKLNSKEEFKVQI